MKIFKNAITSLSGEGRLTLQIPQYQIWFDTNPHQSETVEVPDDWIVLLRSNKSPAVGKESGFYFLTKKGWKDNKDKIKKAFLASKYQRGTWTDFELHAEEHFKTVEKASKKRLAYLEMKVNQVRDNLNESL